MMAASDRAQAKDLPYQVGEILEIYCLDWSLRPDLSFEVRMEVAVIKPGLKARQFIFLRKLDNLVLGFGFGHWILLLNRPKCVANLRSHVAEQKSAFCNRFIQNKT